MFSKVPYFKLQSEPDPTCLFGSSLLLLLSFQVIFEYLLYSKDIFKGNILYSKEESKDKKKLPSHKLHTKVNSRNTIEEPNNVSTLVPTVTETVTASSASAVVKACTNTVK